jgi:hypothetical protein
MTTPAINLNLNFDNSILDTVSNIIIIGSFTFIVSKWTFDKLGINLTESLNNLVHRLTNPLHETHNDDNDNNDNNYNKDSKSDKNNKKKPF